MKKLKFLAPVLAFMFAIVGAFATQNYVALLIDIPNHTDFLGGCTECKEPVPGTPDESGPGVYVGNPQELEDPFDYYCDTDQVNQNPRCYCILDSKSVDANSGNPISTCLPLYKVFKKDLPL